MADMSYEKQADYERQWLFPPSLESLLPMDHPARMVREFVDALDLKALGFKERRGDDGRPSYAASLMLKVWLYGYMTKVRSTRGLERACRDSMGMLWLTGMNRPDHTSLWRFWDTNQEGIRKQFRQLLKMAVKLNLVEMVLHAVDGTKIFSQASEWKGWHRSTLEENLKKVETAIAEIMKQTAEKVGEKNGESGLPEDLQERQQLRAKIEEQLKQLDEIDRDHKLEGDPEARMMKCRKGTHFAYNAQAVVDEATGVIVAADVVNEESDNHQLAPMLEQVEENLGRVADQTVADNGYMALTELAKVEEKQYPVLVNLTEQQKEQEEGYAASRFEYDAEKDCCVCPQGQRLEFDGMKKREKAETYEVRVYRCQSYETCPVRWQCSSSKTGRTVQIHPNHASLVRQRIKQRDPAMRAMLKKRGATIEPVFGWSKIVMGLQRWSVRGKEKVRTQWILQCTALNLLRLYGRWSEGKFAFE